MTDNDNGNPGGEDREAPIPPSAGESGEGSGGEGGGRNGRRRRRSRRSRPDGAAAPVPAAMDPQVREVANSVFSEVLSGAYDEVGTEPVPEVQPMWQEEAQPAAEPAPEDASPAPHLLADPEAAGTDAGAAAATDAEDDVHAHRRVLAPEPDAPKLHKVLAQSGIGSRRDLEAMIEAGRITVNGEPAHTGQRISHGDQIRVDGKPVRIRIHQGRPRVLAYHKPVGEVVTHDDPQQRPTVFRRLPRLPHGKWQSVGRLDLNTEGLLLFTNSGEMANQLMHPRFGVEREYAVRVLGRLDDEKKQQLIEGVEIEGQKAAFLSIEDGGGEGVNHWYRVTLNEGRNREVRKLFDSVGLTVSRLIRIRYGCVVLPRGLKRGAWVDLPEGDVAQLRALAGGGRGRGKGQGPREGREPREGRGPREERSDRGPRSGRDRPPGGGRGQGQGPGQGPGRRADRFEEGPIPSPLQQTFDKRAFKEEQRRPRREYGEDGPIPNPLQQTFDQRALKEQQRRPRREYGEDGPIPNPLVQTFDKRAAQQAQRVREDDDREDGPIPNPLQQTFDRRFAGKGGAGPGTPGRGRSGKPAGKSGGKAGGKPGANPRSGQGKAAGQRQAKGGGAQPDPMRTAVGYIGADAALGKGGRGRRGRGGR